MPYKTILITYYKCVNVALVTHAPYYAVACRLSGCRARLKCDGTRAETRFSLSAKWTSPFKSAGRQFSRLLAAELCLSAVVMLDTPCSEVVWRVLATHSNRIFPLYFPYRASPCAIRFQLSSTIFFHLFHKRYDIQEWRYESLWKRFIGVVSDEKWRTGVKAWVN